MPTKTKAKTKIAKIKDNITVTDIKSINLGQPPVNRGGAFVAAQESKPSSDLAREESFENSEDAGGTVIGVTILGKLIHKDGKEFIEVSSYIVEDDGRGMDLYTMMIDFRGVHHRFTDDHFSEHKNKRNGVGSKTNLAYFSRCKVETTTDRPIPHHQSFEGKDIDSDVLAIIKDIRDQYSECPEGGPDTEVRIAKFHSDPTKDHIVAINHNESYAEESYTKITYSVPVQKVHWSVDSIIKRIRQRIIYLNGGGTYRLRIPCADVDVIIDEPFYKNKPAVKVSASISGNKSDGYEVFFWDNKEGKAVYNEKKSQEITAMARTPHAPDIHVDLIMSTDILSQHGWEASFVECICGSNLNNIDGRSSIRGALSDSNSHYQGSVQSRLYGAIFTVDGSLKQLLRNNRQQIFVGSSTRGKLYKKFVGAVLCMMAHSYTVYADSDEVGNTRHKSIISALRSRMAPILKKMNGIAVLPRKDTKENDLKHPKSGNTMFLCNTCQTTMRVPKDYEPKHCGDGAIDTSKKYCGSSDIQPFKLRNHNIVDIKITPQPVDGFLDCKATIDDKADKKEVSFEIWENHPTFVTEDVGKHKVASAQPSGKVMEKMCQSIKFAYLSAVKNDDREEILRDWNKAEWLSLSKTKRQQVENKLSKSGINLKKILNAKTTKV